MSKETSPVVGNDTDIELREGHAEIAFAFSYKPVIAHGEMRIFPEHGWAKVWMTDGVWSVKYVHIEGFHSRKDNTGPTRKKARISYSFMSSVEEGETYHPDYAPPQWLVNFVAAFEDRLNGKEHNHA